ncbi:MAG TPA: substrate-binding domain-containing protein [Mobilitalea sp.]|nr:substrate-binding domain-containing protein [Mobilitalea sp.]
MKPKRMIINVLVITLAFLIFTIWYQNNIVKMEQTTASSLKHYKVYLITTDKQYQYWEFLNKGASDMAAALGVTYFWDAPTERNTDKQIAVINKAVDSGADALLVAADDPKFISGVIEDAKARGVKVIYVDSPANEEAIITLATDNYEAGTVAGQTMLSYLDKMGVNSGPIGIVSIRNKHNSELRELGFRNIINADGRFTILDTVYTNGDPYVAQGQAERLINNNKDLVGLYGTNEGTSQGVGSAIKASNTNIVGIGYDKTDKMTELLKGGDLKAIINQNPYTMGYLGMAQAVAALLGKDTGPPYINTGIAVIESKNVLVQ